MITHWTLMVLVSLAISTPYGALGRPMEPEAPAELYSELAEEFQRLHNQEIRFLQYLSVQAERQQREESLLEQEREQQQQQQLLDTRNSLLEDGGTALLDELRPEFGAASPLAAGDDGNGRNLNGFGHEIAAQTEPAQKEIPHQKSKNEKKNHHYMSLCHFKLCNMGRKRNQRFPQFWN